MTVTVDPQGCRWVQTNDNKWSLWSDVEEYGYTTRRVIFTIEYVGRERVAFGGGPMRWRVTDRHPLAECRMPQTEFGDLDEAKAWVNAIVRLEGT